MTYSPIVNKELNYKRKLLQSREIMQALTSFYIA